LKTRVYILFLLIFVNQSFASQVVLINSSRDEYVLAGRTIDILEDNTGKLSLPDILSGNFENDFKNYEQEGIYSKNRDAAYWIRFTVEKQENIELSPVLEIYDIKTDNIQLYIPDGKGGYIKKETGDVLPFSKREYKHINFVLDLNNIPKGKTTYYIRLKSQHIIYLYGLIRTHQRFVEYATSEYFLLTIFYGIIMAMFIYNLFLYISIKDRVYLYYLLYIISIGIYSLDRDGMGFQFLWSAAPGLNPYLEDLSLTGMVIFSLLYAKTFINTKKSMPLIDKIINFTIVTRLSYYIVWVLILQKNTNGIYIDILTLFIPYITGYISFRKGYTAARYYLLGYTMLFIGLLVAGLESLNLIPGSVFTFYSLHIGVLLQMLILTFALTDKVRLLMLENNDVQKRIIAELKEKESLKDNLNKELEQKVQERTKELKYRIEQLDTFVYRASHDIKGPLRSLMGLSMLGAKESENKQLTSYFNHSLKTSQRLDKVLSTLLHMTRSRQSELTISQINFENLLNEITESFSFLDEFKNFKIECSVNISRNFYTDEYLLYSILQNLTENALKYRRNTPDSFLNINVNGNEKGVTIVFKDNGKGIHKNYLDKIFEMFIRANESSTGSGLGLFIVKQYVEKLNGTIKVESEYNKGTVFTIYLANNK
jgi:signal transduction histidine kinase